VTARDWAHLDQPRLRHDPQLLERAVDTVLAAALEHGTRYRLQFDADRLPGILGPDATAALLPGPATTVGPGSLREEVHPLAPRRPELLRRVLTFGRGDWPQPPISAVERLLLLDAAGRAVLLLTDGGGELLFALPEPAQTELLTRLRSAGVPAQAVDVVRVDVDSLG
jgi:hypothetical protein